MTDSFWFPVLRGDIARLRRCTAITTVSTMQINISVKAGSVRSYCNVDFEGKMGPPRFTLVG